jgi:hypothetical protein
MLFIIQGFLRQFGNKVTHVPPKRKFEVDYDSDYMKALQEGDIILYRFGGPRDFTGGVISHMTSSPYSHAEIHIKDGYDISAGALGVTFVDGYSHNVNGKKPVVGMKRLYPKMDIFRVKGGLTREQRLIIEAKAYQSLLLPYDYASLFFFPFIRPKSVARRAGNEAYMCSEITAWCYENAGIDLIKDSPAAIEAPGDLGRSDMVEYVGTFWRGQKLDGNYANEFLDEDHSLFSKLVSKLIGLFSKRDEYYQGVALNKKLLEGEYK